MFESLTGFAFFTQMSTAETNTAYPPAPAHVAEQQQQGFLLLRTIADRMIKGGPRKDQEGWATVLDGVACIALKISVAFPVFLDEFVSTIAQLAEDFPGGLPKRTAAAGEDGLAALLADTKHIIECYQMFGRRNVTDERDADWLRLVASKALISDAAPAK